MNRRPLALSSLVLVTVLTAAAGVTRAQNSGVTPTVPKATKLSISLTQGDIDALTKFVEIEAKDLGGDQLDAQRYAREALCSEATASGQPASATYLAAYTAALNTSLSNILKTNPSLIVRLNVGIVVARVAEKDQSTALEPVTVQLLNDKADPVVLWSLKAAKWTLPAAVSNATLAGQSKVLPAIAPTAIAHSSGPVVAAAYDALSLGAAGDPRTLSAGTVKLIVPELLKIIQFRVAQYVASAPPSPAAENIATLFLTNPAIWRDLTPQQQTEAMHQMADLIYLAAHQLPATERATREGLLEVINKTAAGIAVATNNTALNAAIKPLFSESFATPDQQIIEHASGLHGAIRKNLTQFGKLPDPPQVGASAPATTPAQ